MSDLFSVLDGAASAAPLLQVELAQDPRGWARPRATIRYDSSRKPFIHFYKDAETAAFEKALGFQAKVAMRRKRIPIQTGPLAVRVFAMMPIPVSWNRSKRDAALVGTRFAITKPDADNILKMLDAFNEIVWHDDKQVVRSLIVKEYAENPGLIVEVYTLP